MFVLIGLPAAAWVQHILTCAADERWVGLVLGAIVFPVGIVHGIAVWLGFYF